MGVVRSPWPSRSEARPVRKAGPSPNAVILWESLGDLEAVTDLGQEVIGQRSKTARELAPIQCRDLVTKRDAVSLEATGTGRKRHRRRTPSGLCLRRGNGDHDNRLPSGDL